MDIRRLSLFLLSLTFVQAGTLLNDFESPADLAPLQWTSRPPGGNLALSPQFATSGASALHFHCPAWADGRPEWPSFEFVPNTPDWTRYDRLVIDITNPGDTHPNFNLFLADGKIRLQGGLEYNFEIGPRQFRRFVIPLGTFPKEVDQTQISRFHLFTSHPPEDFDLYLDQITLLKPGESLPPQPPAAFWTQVAALHARLVAQTTEELALLRNEVQNELGRKQLDALFQRAQTLSHTFHHEPPQSADQLESLVVEYRDLGRQSRRLLSVDQFITRTRQAGLPAEDILLGTATAMEKLSPRDQPFSVAPAHYLSLSAPRRGHDSCQVLVLPLRDPARQVHFTISPLQNAAGDLLPASAIRCDVTGYVKTETHPPYNPAFAGWWPDPILDFLGPIDIPAGDLQSFWLRVSVPEGQASGLYQGDLIFHAAGQPDRRIPMRVVVRRHVLPKASPLPLAITFGPSDHPLPETLEQQEQWRKNPDYPVNLWNKHKAQWVDFLANYYINYDHLYRHAPPDWDVLTRLRDQGQLRAFNLRSFDMLTRAPEAREQTLAAIRADYLKAKELGILDRAYIYGFDEVPAEGFPELESCAALLKREFPGLLVMTTALDHSFGSDSKARSVDAWCPLTPDYNPANAQAARAKGKQVWWYICCCPATSPHANIFVETPGIEARLLMGAMSAKFQVDGFLYYQISIWNSEKPITSGPYTDWNPRSWRTWNGDGSWTCVGPDGVPLATLRLENFRAGLEDYASRQLLQATLEAEKQEPSLPAEQSQKWIAAAEQALLVPDDMVASMLEYSRDPATLLRWRERIDELLDANFRPEMDPWKSTSLMKP